MKACRLVLTIASTLWTGVAFGQYATQMGPVHAGYGPGSVGAGSGVEPAGYVMFPSDGGCGPGGCGLDYGGGTACYGEPCYGDVCYGDPCFDGAVIDGCCAPTCRWGFRAGWISMKRVADSTPLVDFNGPNTNLAFTNVINERDFDFDYSFGTDSSIFFNVDCTTRVEFRFLWLPDTEETISRVQTLGATPPTPNVRLNTTTPSFLNVPAGTTAIARYRNEIYSGEVNVINAVCCDRLRFIGGFRYLKLEESLNTRFSTRAGSLDLDTQNDLFGVQGGVDVALAPVSECFSFDLLFKGGVYYNDVTTTVNDTTFVPGIGRNATSGDDTVSIVGEAGLYGTWRVTKWCLVRGGYQALWLHSVATAADQLGTTSNLNPGVAPLSLNPESDGNSIYHGTNVSVIFEF